MAQWNSPSTTLIPRFLGRRLSGGYGKSVKPPSIHVSHFTFHICSAELGLVNPQKSKLNLLP
jgi:hypothetical protein